MKRVASCPAVSGGSPHPVNTDGKSECTYTPGERVSLQPVPSGVHEYLNAVVLDTVGRRLKVRALHPFYREVNFPGGKGSSVQLVIPFGTVFEVARNEVFVVALRE